MFKFFKERGAGVLTDGAGVSAHLLNRPPLAANPDTESSCDEVKMVVKRGACPNFLRAARERLNVIKKTSGVCPLKRKQN